MKQRRVIAVFPLVFLVMTMIIVINFRSERGHIITIILVIIKLSDAPYWLQNKSLTAIVIESGKRRSPLVQRQ